MNEQEFRGDDYFEGHSDGYNEGFSEARRFYLDLMKELLDKAEKQNEGDVN